MTPEQAKKLILWAKKNGIKTFKAFDLDIEFFPQQPEHMKLDPKALAEALSDSMPDNEAMLFASSEGIPEEPENLISQQRDGDSVN